MRDLIEFFVKRVVFGNFLTIGILIVGTTALLNVRREVFPTVAFDIITINTILPGSTPEEAEKLLTNPIEQDLKEVEGIKRLNSVSAENRSYIVAELDPDVTTEDKGKSDIQDVVDRFEDLPQGAEKPLVTAVDTKLNPIVEIHVSGIEDELELRRVAKDLESELEDVDGVARVVPYGIRDLEIRVDADPRKLAQFRLSLDDIINSLSRHNLSIPGGSIPPVVGPNSQEKLVRTLGDVRSPEEVEDIVVRANDLGNGVRIGNVAKAYWSLEKAAILSRTNGKPSIALTVLKKETADAITIVDKVQDRVKELESTLLKGVSTDSINDLSEFTQRRIDVLSGNLWFGIVLILIVLTLILPLKVSLLVGLTIPFCFLSSMILFDYYGITLNLISMLGLIIVSGMIVDNAIVVTDNCVRLMEEGMDPTEAAIKGTHQVWISVAASTITTLLAFLPLALMSGIFGKFVRQIPLGVIIPLIVSFIQAFIILPGFIRLFVRAEKRYKEKSRNPLTKIVGAIESAWDSQFVPWYTRVLTLCLNRRYWVVALTFGLFAGTIVLAATRMKLILFPSDGVEAFFVKVDTSSGSSLSNTERLVAPVEAAVAKLPPEEVKDFTATIGIQQQDPNDPAARRGTEFAQVAVFLTPEASRKRTAQEIIDGLRKEIGTPEGVERITFEMAAGGPPVGKPVDLGVRGEDYAEIMKAAAALKEELKKYKGVNDIRDDYILGKEEIRVSVDPTEAAAAGLTVAGIGTAIRASFEGVVATSVKQLREENDIRVTIPEDAKRNPDVLASVLIPNPQGNLVPLGRISKISATQGLSSFNHEDNKRQVRVTAMVDEEITSSRQVNDRIRDELLPVISKQFPKVGFYFGGEDRDTQESLASLGRAQIAALLGIFLTLLLSFRNVVQPLIVMVTIPLGVISVILTLFVHGMPLSFLAILGIIALGGVIVNNAIVFIDFVNQARESGMEKMESIVNAGRVRVRPIFLTTVTTVAGLLPTAYGIGGLDEFVVPIAMALGWGLLIGSLLTAFVIPPVIAIADDILDLIRKHGGPLKYLLDDSA
jgi:multidrug efflux pump subunit AcrB